MFDLYPLSYNGNMIVITTLFRILFPLVTILLVAGLFFAFRTKSQKSIKITKIILASFLLFLYLFKAVFWIVRIITISENNTFSAQYITKAFGLDIPSFLVILSSVVLFISAFSKKPSKFMEFLKFTLLGVGLPSAIISLFTIDIIDIYDSYYHVLNIIAMLFNLLLIFIPLYLIKIKELKPSLDKYWYAISGYICLTSICMTLSLIIREGNLSEMTYSKILRKIGIQISFPWHLLIIIPCFLIISFILFYAITFVYKKIIEKDNDVKNEKEEKLEQTPKRNEFFDLYAFATKSICCMQGFLVLIILSAIVRNPFGSIWGILCLIPLIMTIFCLLAVFEMEKQANLNDEDIFNKGNKEAKKIIAFALIGDIFFGLSFAKQMKNERESIIERKEREEKRRLREQKKKQEQEEQNSEQNNNTKAD